MARVVDSLKVKKNSGSTLPFSVFLQIKNLFCDSILGDDTDFNSITTVDVTLASRNKPFLNQLNSLGRRVVPAVTVLAIFKSNKIIQKRHDEFHAAAVRTNAVGLTLE